MRVTDLGMWTLLLAAPVVRALRARRSAEMGRRETSAAMQPRRICLLREVALAARYARLGASSPEISLFRRRKSDLSAILGPLFSPQNTVLVTSPASPCVCGHKPCVRATGANSGGHAENGFLPRQGRIFPGRYCIFCSPATPQRRIQHGRPCRMGALGAGARRAAGVRCGLRGVYTGGALPRSIYQVEGAPGMCHRDRLFFSKSAGFTGLRWVGGGAAVPKKMPAACLRGLYALVRRLHQRVAYLSARGSRRAEL